MAKTHLKLTSTRGDYSACQSRFSANRDGAPNHTRTTAWRDVDCSRCFGSMEHGWAQEAEVQETIDAAISVDPGLREGVSQLYREEYLLEEQIEAIREKINGLERQRVATVIDLLPADLQHQARRAAEHAALAIRQARSSAESEARRAEYHPEAARHWGCTGCERVYPGEIAPDGCWACMGTELVEVEKAS